MAHVRFVARFVDIPSQIGRERANPTVGYLPTSAPLLAQHNLKRTYERVQQEGESLLHPLCSPGRGSNQKRSTSTALCRCCTTRRHTRSSAQARTNQRRRQSLAPESRRRLHNVQKLPVRPGFFGTVSFWGRPRCLSAAPSCKEAFRGSQDPLRSFQCRQQSIVSARDDVSTPTEGHNGCGKRASRLFQPTCTSVQEHDHKQMGTQSCPSEYARSLPTESPRLRERSKTLASSQKAPLRGHPSGCNP